MSRAGCLLLGAACALAPAVADDIYYRQGADGALILTNIPDHRDLRAYPTHGAPRGMRSGEAYRQLISKTALKHGLAPELVYALAAVESNFNARAVSPKGALGLMQLMPETAARFGVIDPFNPVENVLGGVRYLRYLLDLFHGDHRLALAAYNAGENVVLALRGVPPYQETRRYVAKVLRLFGTRKPYAETPSARLAEGTAGAASRPR
jgi:soluble lytic murein transglycosylase-like protein